jgi:hypothetical protein
MAVDPYKQYKLLVEDVSRVSDRRHNTNLMYLSANSILLGASAILLQQSGLGVTVSIVLAAIVAFAGILLCLGWLLLISGYRRVNRTRYEMLRRIERDPSFRWPVKIFDETSLKVQRPGFTTIEAFVPLVFILTYLLVAAAMVAFKLNLIAL